MGYNMRIQLLSDRRIGEELFREIDSVPAIREKLTEPDKAKYFFLDGEFEGLWNHVQEDLEAVADYFPSIPFNLMVGGEDLGDLTMAFAYDGHIDWKPLELPDGPTRFYDAMREYLRGQ